MASGLVSDRQQSDRYSGEVIPRQNTQAQPAPPPRPTSAPSGAPTASPPPPAAPTSSAPSPAAPTAAQVQSAAPPPPPPAPPAQAAAPTPPPTVTPPTQQAAVPPPGAPRAPPQLREVAPTTAPPGAAQPIQPSNIQIPRENPQAPKLNEVKPYVPPAGLEDLGTVYVGGSGGSVVSGRSSVASGGPSRAAPLASTVPGTRPLAEYAGASRGSQQVATIQFGNGSSKLSDRDRSILREVASQYRQRGASALRVVGHASSRTSAEDIDRHRLANAKVSAERAEAVARELVRMGVPAQAIYAGAVSDANPKYFEFMPTGEAGNRRAEIFIDF
jgi:outer membrane protein OmpA-like peptidoglycan-associated protein